MGFGLFCVIKLSSFVAFISFIRSCPFIGDFVVVIAFLVSHPGLIELGGSTNLNKYMNIFTCLILLGWS